MKGCPLIKTHSMFCLLDTQLVALGCLYDVLFSPHCGGKINLFLMASSSPHIPTASKCFEVLTNLLMQSHWKCCITLTLQKGCWCTGGCSFLGRSISHIQSAYSAISVYTFKVLSFTWDCRWAHRECQLEATESSKTSAVPCRMGRDAFL